MDKKSKNLTITRTKAQAFKVGDRAKVIDSNENRIADKGVIIAVEPGKVVLKPTFNIFYKESPKGLIFWAKGVDWISKRYPHLKLEKAPP